MSTTTCNAQLTLDTTPISDRTFFLDCAVMKRQATPFTVFDGLAHLNGEQIKVIAAGSVLAGTYLVAAGSVTLPTAVTVAIGGLSYTSDLQTLKLSIGGVTASEAGRTNAGTRQRAGRITLRLNNTRGVKVGLQEDSLVDVKWRADEDYDAPTDLFTGDKQVLVAPQWKDSIQIFVRQTDPLPVTVLAVIPDIGVNEAD